MTGLVLVHSVWRWALLLAALAALIKAFAGWFGKQPYGGLDRRLGMIFTIAMDLQVLIGLILWIGERWFTVFSGGGMSDPQIRFFAIEHPLLMLAALVLAHIGYRRSRQGENEVVRHRTAALFYLASLILVVAGIPWDRLAR